MHGSENLKLQTSEQIPTVSVFLKIYMCMCVSVYIYIYIHKHKAISQCTPGLQKLIIGKPQDTYLQNLYR